MSQGSLRRRAAVIAAIGHGPGVRIEEHLAAVEAMASLGGKGTVGSVAIKLPRSDLRHEDVPVIEGPIAHRIEADLRSQGAN